MAATKIDIQRDLLALHKAGRSPALIEVPELTYAMVDGHGDPTTAPEYEQAVEAVYTVAYAVKFALRAADEADYGVMPLEGLWWADDMDAFLAGGDRSSWHWTMMICQPVPIPDVVCEAALRRAAKKIPDVRAWVRLATLEEGRCVQVMHYGPYADEGPTIAALHAYIAEQGLGRAGRHHEIYLGDPRRTAPERLRTIIRQPVR